MSLMHYQLLPEDRLAELMADLFGVKLAAATIARMSRTCAARLRGFAETVRDLVAAAPVKHMDETGFRIGGKTRWLHVASTALLTFYRVCAKRGTKHRAIFGLGKVDNACRGQAVAVVGQHVEALRQGGYVFVQSLANGARNLRDRWPDTEGAFDRELRQIRYDVERSLDRVDDAMRYAERGPDDGRIQTAQTEMQSAARRLSEAQQRLARIYELDARDITAMDARLDALEWSVQQLNAASFKPDSGEALIIAAPAEWTETTGDRRDMDGVLYLTDRRVLFEQKERTGAFLGLFGGRNQQALTWAVALTDIEDVRAEDRGIFGVKDMLYLSLRPGAEPIEITIEVKRSADNQEWAAFVRQAKAGGYEQERR